MPILGKREAFPWAVYHKLLKRTEAEIGGKQMQSIKSWIAPSLSTETKFSGKIFSTNPGTQRGWEALPHLHICPHTAGWEAYRQSRSQKKGTVPKRLHGSVCCSGTPRSRQALRPECLIYHEYFHRVNSGSFHSFCPLRNPYCWKIAKLLYSGALGWLLCRTRNVSKGLVRKTVAMNWGRE